MGQGTRAFAGRSSPNASASRALRVGRDSGDGRCPESSGVTACSNPLRGAWNADRIESLVEAARDLGARLIANVDTGRLWGSRPPIEVLLGELEGRSVQDPAADWEVGHFVELRGLDVEDEAAHVVAVR